MIAIAPLYAMSNRIAAILLLIACCALPRVGLAEPSRGAPITPELAKSVYDRLRTVTADDGCALQRLDTAQFQIRVELSTRAGGNESVTLLIGRGPEGARRAGQWSMEVPASLAAACPTTLSAYETQLSSLHARGRLENLAENLPIPNSTLERSRLTRPQWILVALMILAVIGTLVTLLGDLRAGQLRWGDLVMLGLLSVLALSLRLSLSPRTFLHEYYHVEETIRAHLFNAAPSIYGETGAAIYRAVAMILGPTDEVGLIFVTNAVIASLAIPLIALLQHALTGSRVSALCAAMLLCCLPQHLRFSAAEDLFVVAITLALWSGWLFAVYLRRRRLIDAIWVAVATAVAMQSRPEMLLLPLLLVALVFVVPPRSGAVLLDRRSWIAAALLVLLLVPRLIHLATSISGFDSSPGSRGPSFYIENLVILDARTTPPIYWVILAAGLVIGLWRAPRMVLWAMLGFVGYAWFSLSLFSNDTYNIRSQLLANTFLMMVGGAIGLWRQRFRPAVATFVMALFAAVVLLPYADTITALADQQRQWSFLQKTIPTLPEDGRLLAAIEPGGRQLDAFPLTLLASGNKTFETIDVRKVVTGKEAWPEPGDDLLFYQGMYCFFSFHDEPAPSDMTPLCRAVHERYVLEPLITEAIDAPGYSHLQYTQPPFTVGFFRAARAR